MDVMKTAKSFNTIVLSLVTVGITFQVWANTQYVTYTALDKRDIKELRRDISDLDTQIRFSADSGQKNLYEALKRNKENQIKEIKGE